MTKRFGAIPASLVVGVRFYIAQRDKNGHLMSLATRLDSPIEIWNDFYMTLEEARAAARRHILSGDIVHGIVRVDVDGQTFHGGIAYESGSEEATVRSEGWGSW